MMVTREEKREKRPSRVRERKAVAGRARCARGLKRKPVKPAAVARWVRPKAEARVWTKERERGRERERQIPTHAYYTNRGKAQVELYRDSLLRSFRLCSRVSAFRFFLRMYRSWLVCVWGIERENNPPPADIVKLVSLTLSEEKALEHSLCVRDTIERS